MSNYMKVRTSTVSVQLDRQARLFRVLQTLSERAGHQADRGDSLREAISAAVEKVDNDTNVVL
jgi:hypothetical protein